jgi:hypothetical protein
MASHVPASGDRVRTVTAWQLHVTERSKGVPTSKSGDSSIVNPSRLQPWLADNICVNCHQTGDTRVLQPDKDYRDFRPGTPLNNTVGIFRVPYRLESPPDEDLLSTILLWC